MIFKVICNRDKRVTTNVDRAQELLFSGLMKRFHAPFVISKGDRMNQSVDWTVTGSDLLGNRFDLVLELDIANVDWSFRQQLCGRFNTCLATNDVDHFRANLFERFADMPSNTLFIGDAENHNRFAFEL